MFGLKTGTPWEYLPREMGCGSSVTCWHRLRDWQAAGIWQKICDLHKSVLDVFARTLPDSSVRQIQFVPVSCLPPGKSMRGQALLLTELPLAQAAFGPLQKLFSPIRLAFRG
jgi:hypothetical protein